MFDVWSDGYYVCELYIGPLLVRDDVSGVCGAVCNVLDFRNDLYVVSGVVYFVGIDVCSVFLSDELLDLFKSDCVYRV